MVAVIALAAAGCGGAGGGEASSGPTAVPATPAPTPTSATPRATAGDSTTVTTTAGATTSPSTATVTTAVPAPDGPSTTSGGDGSSGTSGFASEAPVPVALATAGRGDSGDGVAALQTRLLELGFGLGTADGEYGRRTSEAVLSFQTVAGLNPTGEADADTVAALGSFRYDGPVLAPGDEGPAVVDLQARLAAGPFDPGPIDGKFGTATTEAVWALAKLVDLPVDSTWGPADEWAMGLVAAGTLGPPTVSHDRRWVEVDLSDQLLRVYDPGQTVPTLVSHVSTGSGVAWENENHRGSSITPTGSFEIYRRIAGWRESSLDIGRLYNPLYFVGGIAFHGALSVPLYPASHGCVRVPMHIAEYLPAELPDGTPVEVRA